MHRRLRLYSAGLAVLLAASMRGGAATFAVDSALDTADANPGDGICADAIDAACSLRAAIDESNASPGVDEIELPTGDFVLTVAGSGEDVNASGDLDIAGDVTIRGAGADATRIDGSALDRVIDIHAGAEPRTVHFEQLTVQNGMLIDEGLHDSGVGVRVGETVHLLLDDVVVRGNRSTNTSGATAIDIGGCVEGTHVRILDNRDTHEDGSGSALAALYVHGADACLTLLDSEISGNLADWAGAILADDGAPILIRRSLISDNTARFAGAMILNSNNDTLLENVTISGNHGNPGAILNDGGAHLNLVNSTVTGNGPSNASCVVGGIQDVHGGFGLTFLSNTVLYGNGPGFSADDCVAATSVGGGNMIGDSKRCRFDALPSDRLDVDPELGPLADNGGFTRSHLPGSAAIDAGQAGMCPAADQRGLPRPVDGDGNGDAACDVGAVEVQRDVVFVDGFDG
jgi:hypothetical protein